jgi:hypothetical protein
MTPWCGLANEIDDVLKDKASSICTSKEVEQNVRDVILHKTSASMKGQMSTDDTDTGAVPIKMVGLSASVDLLTSAGEILSQDSERRVMVHRHDVLPILQVRIDPSGAPCPQESPIVADTMRA